MKRALAYVTTAILLGFAVMMLPKTLQPLQTQPATSPSQPTSYSETNFPFGDESRSKTLPYALTSQPLNLLPSSLILFSGLIVALGAYAIFKRKT